MIATVYWYQFVQERSGAHEHAQMFVKNVFGKKSFVWMGVGIMHFKKAGREVGRACVQGELLSFLMW